MSPHTGAQRFDNRPASSTNWVSVPFGSLHCGVPHAFIHILRRRRSCVQGDHADTERKKITDRCRLHPVPHPRPPCRANAASSDRNCGDFLALLTLCTCGLVISSIGAPMNKSDVTEDSCSVNMRTTANFPLFLKVSLEFWSSLLLILNS